MSYGLLVENYLAGPEILRRSISGMSDDQLNASPIPFKWSTRQVVLHLADMDLIYADHMKRVIAEEGTDIAWRRRQAVRVASGIRQARCRRRGATYQGHTPAHGSHIAAIDADDFKRKGIHSVDGPLTLADLLQRATDHIPHHAQYIEEKRKALNIGERAIPFHLASVGVMERVIA